MGRIVREVRLEDEDYRRPQRRTRGGDRDTAAWLGLLAMKGFRAFSSSAQAPEEPTFSSTQIPGFSPRLASPPA